MGAYCFKWCCRPITPRITVRHKVREVFHCIPGLSEEDHARIKTEKLLNYLKDRRSELKKLVNEISKVIGYLCSKDASPEEISKLKIGLTSLGILVQHYKDYFLLLCYSLSYNLITKPYFYTLHSQVYKLIQECVNNFPNDKPVVLQNILYEFVQYCVMENELTSDDLGLLVDLVKAMKLEIKKAKGKEGVPYWKYILSLVIKRLTQTTKQLSIISPEFSIVQSLASQLCTEPHSTHEFLAYIVDTLDTKDAWNSNAVLIFEKISRLEDNEGLLCMI